jgi:hypothetical protein
MVKVKKPNFFIIGAPKCGTTSLAAWLSEHPQVFFSKHKEPHHFNTDQNWVITPGRDDYERLFAEANEQHLAIGEGSVWYLYSKQAINNIKKYAPQAKFIVCLRNPVEMAYSLHGQQIFSGNEHIYDFKEAWSLNDVRLRGELVRHLCREPKHLAYGTACLLGEQLQRLFLQVTRDRVHILFLDDVKNDPKTAYLSVLKFLGLSENSNQNFEVKNLAKKRKSMLIRQAVLLLGNIKRRLGIKKSFGILTMIDSHNIKYRTRQSLDVEMKRKMQDYFHKDIALLESLLDKDLSSWKKNDR